ncbi:hypothetical protein RM844_30095 [Streptomyces sp. DSM 44915]|uniref:Uncharacterized protein n=1 Tax=Streptomyces chisholmiae TaxID=3075540 RepID=A0ABU2K0D2_9ACTN|nr:hypothetical protein [Streptomyces sp. DSM 44915]MDT0270532.1 hypothetical protein [Streptomyces sp. DSM 44915]
MAGASGWDARLGWAHGLIADERARREAALARLAEERARDQAAGDRFNALLRETRSNYAAPGVREAFAGWQAAKARVLPDALWSRSRADDIRHWPGLPYALLYLEWEARHPREWTRHAKKWGTKERLLRDLAVPEHATPVRAKLTDLVELAVQRPYRCKDRGYVGVARAVDSADLRDRLTAAARTANPWARRQAGYVRWLLDHPGLPNTRHVWRRWNDTEHDAPD